MRLAETTIHTYMSVPVAQIIWSIFRTPYFFFPSW